MENGNMRLFAANRKQKTELCFPWSAKKNGKRRLLFKQTSPSKGTRTVFQIGTQAYRTGRA
jgi:hypothetical protein